MNVGIETATEFQLNDVLTLKKFNVTFGDKELRITVEVEAINIFRAIDIVERERLFDSPGSRVLSIKELRPKFVGG